MTDSALPPAPRLVLDTNVVLALWVFADPALLLLRQLIDQQKVQLWTRGDALHELADVLARAHFALAPARQSAIFNHYRECSAVLDGALKDSSKLPLVGDPDDQKFLEIARDSAASHLLTRDKLLLRAGRHRLARALFVTERPECFCASVQTAAENGTINVFNHSPNGQEQSS